ncbi:MAG TPA: hypothetical protein VFT30_03795, partial [Nitrospira sp.]|nr:hypothetical protein [Nitrospira sp.]
VVQFRSHKTQPSHHLDGVHQRATPYSARREPQRLRVRAKIRLAPSLPSGLARGEAHLGTSALDR